MSIEEQTPVETTEAQPEVDPFAPDPTKAADDPTKYTPTQKVALFAGMCKAVGEDLGVFAKEIVANDTGEGYLLSYETVAVLSAKILRAKSGVTGLARVLEAAIPKEVNIAEVVASVNPDLKKTDTILSSLASAVLSNKVDASQVPTAQVTGH
jgi:hypothetical protein